MGNVAAATLELVDSETRRIVHEAEQTAKRTLELNAEVLENLANALLHSETLSGPALDVYLAAVKRWPEALLDGVDDHEPPIHARRPVESGSVATADGGGHLREDSILGDEPGDGTEWLGER
jgi:anti-sigma regulatory factor (Ser/Thr protein kinase)